MRRKHRKVVAMFTILTMCLLLFAGCRASSSDIPAETTDAPVEENTTEAPELTTEEPSTAEPATQEQTEEPTTEEPTTEEPTTEAPKEEPLPELTPTGYEIKTEITRQMFGRFFSYNTTKEQVERTVGLPHAWLGSDSCRGHVYYTPDGEIVSVYYTTKFGKCVVDRIEWLNGGEGGQSKTLVSRSYIYKDMIPTGNEIKTEITLEMFKSFVIGTTTEEEILEAVGPAHTRVENGSVADVYFTSDYYVLAVSYMTVNEKSVLKTIKLFHDDKSYSDLQKLADPEDIHTEEVQIAGDGIVQTFETGKTVIADLDGDGENEKITVVEGDDYNSLKMQIDDLYVGEETFARLAGYMEGLLKSEFYLIDLDTSDQWIEIAIFDAGPSADPETTFLRYHDGKLIQIGKAQCWPPTESFSAVSRLTVLGDGTVSGRARYDVVQTQFVTMRWKLEDASEFHAKLEEQIPEYYEFYLRDDGSQQMYLAQDTPFFAEMNGEEQITLPKDTVVDIARYYPESGWLQVIYEQGAKAVWLKLNYDGMIQPLNIHEWNLGEFFRGLAAAD